MTQKEIQRACQTWQKRLRLQDWDVTVVLEPDTVMAGEVGNVQWDSDEQSALIRILEAHDDHEGILVHELNHLRLHKWPFEVYGDPNLENAVNLLTACFLAAYKRKKK